LVVNSDAAVVAKLLDAASLGLYQMAHQLANVPATQISNAVAQVTFPWYAQARGDLEQFRRFFFHAVRRVTLVAFPIAALTMAWAEQLVLVGLGERWIGMIPTLRVLCLFGAVRAINGCWGSVYQAAGRPEALAKVTAIQVIVLITLVPPLTWQFGIVGAAVAATLANVVTFMTAAAHGLRILEAPARTFISALSGGLLVTVVALIIAGIVGMLLPSDWGALLQLGVHLGAMTIAAAMIALIWRKRSSLLVRSLMADN
jgi:O-antigen/teichoic acid export membrane protein